MNILKQQIRKASVESATHVEIFKDISSGKIGYVDKQGQFVSFGGSAISQNILDALYSSNSPDASNYFVTLADLSGLGETTITVVANYNALPDPTTVSQDFYWVSNTQGTKWLPGSLGGTFYNSGLYYSNGVSWEYLEVPYQATQAEVNAGVNTDKFVTPATLNASTQWSTKADTVHTHVEADITNLNTKTGIHFPFKNIGNTRQSLAVKGYTTTTLSLADKLAYRIPVKPMHTEIIESIQVENTTAIAGGKAQLFVYNESGSLIFQSADIPCTSLAITTVTFPANFTIEKGKVYYFGIVTNGNITFKAIGTLDLYSYGRVAGSTTGLTVIRGNIAVFGTLPTTLTGFTGTTYNTLAMPEFLFKLT